MENKIKKKKVNIEALNADIENMKNRK